jgi:FG-GAP-like repeat/ASPIC and UnbV
MVRTVACLRTSGWSGVASWGLSHRLGRTGLGLGYALFLVFVGMSAVLAAEQAPGTRRMAARLAAFRERLDPMNLGFLSRERAELYLAALGEATSRAEQISFSLNLGLEWLNAGESRKALSLFRDLDARLAREASDYHKRIQLELLLRQAVACLRIGEQSNCLSNHTADSCLLPIQARGVHRDQEGSRAAQRYLRDWLELQPDNLHARWLWNITAMTLGEYPEKVPAPWLIPPAAFESEFALTRFRDVAPVLGLDITNLAGGSVVDDFDGDSFLDVMTSSMGISDPLRFFRNRGDGTFVERTMEAGLKGEDGGLNLVSADYDNDGHLDVLVLRGGWMGDEGKFPNSLLRNLGNGTFADVTEEAGLLSFHPTQTAVWWDYDSDGWLDLFIGNETQGEPAHPCELYRNNRDGTFSECAAACGLAKVGMVKGVASGDYNNDGRPDLYVSLREGKNMLFRNDGPRRSNGATVGSAWTFVEVTAQAGVEQPFDSFGCWFFDYDNDGWSDLFVAGYRLKNPGDIAADYLGRTHTSERCRLYRNSGDGRFRDVTEEAGLNRMLYVMGCNFGDLDNDGWLDFYLGTGDPDLSRLLPNRMFRNDGGRRFQDVTTSGGFGHLQKGHGISFADIDNDGDQDVFEQIGGAYSGDVYRNVLFENPGFRRHWVTLKLEGVKAPKCALGARVELVLDDMGTRRKVMRTVGTGGSFGCNPFRLEVGLGSAERIEELRILWPASGRRDVVRNLAVDRAYRFREGDTQVEPLPWKSYKIPAESSRASVHAAPHQH